MPANRHRAATPAASRRRKQGKAKSTKSAACKSRKPTQQKAAAVPPAAGQRFFALPMRGDFPFGDPRRALDAAFRAFARLSRSKSRVLH
jgi:hypothetical protein